MVSLLPFGVEPAPPLSGMEAAPLFQGVKTGTGSNPVDGGAALSAGEGPVALVDDGAC